MVEQELRSASLHDQLRNLKQFLASQLSLKTHSAFQCCRLVALQSSNRLITRFLQVVNKLIVKAFYPQAWWKISSCQNPIFIDFVQREPVCTNKSACLGWDAMGGK